MTYTCGVCSRQIEGDVLTLQDHTDKHIIDLVKHDHPDWVDEDGMCRQCYDYYKGEINGSIFKDAPCAIRIRKSKRFLSWVKNIFKK